MLATLALPSFLTQPPATATSPPLPSAPGEPPGLAVMYTHDRALCWPARAAGLQPGHALALLMTQSHACLGVAFPGTDPLCHDNNLTVKTGISRWESEPTSGPLRCCSELFLCAQAGEGSGKPGTLSGVVRHGDNPGKRGMGLASERLVVHPHPA